MQRRRQTDSGDRDRLKSLYEMTLRVSQAQSRIADRRQGTNHLVQKGRIVAPFGPFCLSGSTCRLPLQYDYATDTHELFLDGKLIWKLTNPDGKKLVNDLEHNWQFSVFCPLWKYTKYGGGFSYLGPNNFFSQIGDIRISDIRRYE